ncbi:hypothetical protein PsorP6_000393 [Peronosclerospora sorghi]|uniref:Uncharacterized protein n=1 Tax=Peronosclerospora sorghi TaxID=230839 RepID=A0ACC0WTU3_9STRA|nr:hypothetical protein PsorP6_000393 [Peronosclerospora sorghi]
MMEGNRAFNATKSKQEPSTFSTTTATISDETTEILDQKLEQRKEQKHSDLKVKEVQMTRYH